MAWRNCESYVSRAIWHGEVGCTGKRELYENMGKTGSWTMCCFRAVEVWKLIPTRERSHDAHMRKRKKGQHGDGERESNLHRIAQIVMRSDSSAGGEQGGTEQ